MEIQENKLCKDWDSGSWTLATCLWCFSVNPALGRAQLRIYIKSHMEKSKEEKEALGEIIKTSFKRKGGREKVSSKSHSFPNFSMQDYASQVSHLPEGTPLHIHTSSIRFV